MKKHRGLIQLMGIALAAVLGVILLFNVILPIFNTAYTTNSLNVSAAGTAGTSNLSGYAGANGIATASYVVLVLSVLAVAAGAVVGFFGAANR